MPTYVYQVIKDDDSEGEMFEIQQPMSEDALTRHPETGEPVRRVYQPPNIASKYTPGHTKKLIDTGNVEKAGFTKYERDKLTGRYHKTAGKEGPATLNPNS
jgi:predicted nucleic acid-binding Zn ribbon protein